jgi:hypothetical protein
MALRCRLRDKDVVMNLGTWLRNCGNAYRNDSSRHRLLETIDEAFQVREDDPGDALHRYREGKELANRLGEQWWSLLFDKLQLDAKVHFLRDYRDVLEPAEACVREVGHTIYDDFPGSLSIHDTLLAAQIGIDAEGYSLNIRQTLDALEHNMSNEATSDVYCLLARQREFAIEEFRWDEAHDIGLRELELIHSDRHPDQANHFGAFVYAGLCRAAFERGMWDKLEEYATEGESFAQTAGHQCELAEILAWRAVSERHRDDRDAASRTLREAATIQHSIQMPPRFGYFRARIAYYEIGNQPAEMLHALDEALASVADRNRVLSECRLRLERLRVLIYMRRSVEEDVELARHSAHRLRFPDRYLRLVDVLEKGDAEMRKSA